MATNETLLPCKGISRHKVDHGLIFRDSEVSELRFSLLSPLPVSSVVVRSPPVFSKREGKGLSDSTFKLKIDELQLAIADSDRRPKAPFLSCDS